MIELGLNILGNTISDIVDSEYNKDPFSMISPFSNFRSPYLRLTFRNYWPHVFLVHRHSGPTKELWR